MNLTQLKVLITTAEAGLPDINPETGAREAAVDAIQAAEAYVKEKQEEFEDETDYFQEQIDKVKLQEL